MDAEKVHVKLVCKRQTLYIDFLQLCAEPLPTMSSHLQDTVKDF